MSDPAINPNRSALRRRQKPPEVRIVLETSQLYSGSASDLLKNELAKLIEESRRHTDVSVLWFLPEIVKMERRYQMMEAAKELLPATLKLERLLGHGLAISEEILLGRVNATIEKQLSSLGLTVLTLDAARVDWNRLINDAAERRAPFEGGKHEKGFRDSIIVETFVQFLEASPKSASTCRMALVTGDVLLADAVRPRAQASNVRVLRSLEELKDFINLVVGDVTEEFVNRIREDATNLFFTEGDQTTLFYKDDLQAKVSATYKRQLESRPKGATARKNGRWLIGPNRFSHKKGQRVHWIASIRVEATAYRQEVVSAAPSSSNFTVAIPADNLSTNKNWLTSIYPPMLGKNSLIASGQPSEFFNSPSVTLGNYGAPSQQTRDVPVASGQSVFEVSWSATVTAAGKLTNPRVDEHRHVETTWDGGPEA